MYSRLTHPCHLELHRVRMSPVHQGGIHLAADATVSIVYVQAAPTAVLETCNRRLLYCQQGRLSQPAPPLCLAWVLSTELTPKN